MAEKLDIPSDRTETGDALKNGASPADSSVADGIRPASASEGSRAPKSMRRFFAALNAFLNSLDEEEPEPPPPPERPLKETFRAFIDCCRDRDRRAGMRKEFRAWGLTKLFHGAVFFILSVLTILATTLALDFNENHRVNFLPPDDVVNYLTAEHEALEAAALKVTPSAGKNDSIPPESFDARCIEVVKPKKIYGDEYGVYLMTSKDWYNGEHGIFFAKDEENMPPNLNWGLIEGRIYTYAIYD